MVTESNLDFLNRSEDLGCISNQSKMELATLISSTLILLGSWGRNYKSEGLQ